MSTQPYDSGEKLSEIEQEIESLSTRSLQLQKEIVGHETQISDKTFEVAELDKEYKECQVSARVRVRG